MIRYEHKVKESFLLTSDTQVIQGLDTPILQSSHKGNGICYQVCVSPLLILRTSSTTRSYWVSGEVDKGGSPESG